MAELETKPKPQEPARDAEGTRRLAHAISGCGMRGKDKETIERQALEWIQSLPEAERGSYTRTEAPRKFGSIAKVRVDLATIHQHVLEARAGQRGNMPPARWAAVEPSTPPHQRIAADLLARRGWGLTMDLANADMLFGREVVARLGRE